MSDRRIDPVKALFSHLEHLRILHDLTNAVPYLSAAETALVDYLLNHPTQVASMNASELSKAAGVSEATLYRLCRQLGLDGYAPLKDQMGEVGRRYEAGFVAPISIQEKADPQLTGLQWRAYFGMRAMLDACIMDEHALERAADAIAVARSVNICGIAPLSGSLAQMATVSFQWLGLASMLWTDPHSMTAKPSVFGANDVLIAISHSGESTSLADFLETAGQNGATTIALVNYRQSTIAKVAQIPLVTSMRECVVQNGDLLPRMSQLLVIQVLVDMVRNRLELRND